MSDEIISQLSRGQLPDKARLRGWFQAALTKKLAVITLPPAFWESDPKRNPDAVHLLWAAVLLDDLEGYKTVQTIMMVEKVEQHRHNSVPSRIEKGIKNLLMLVSSEEIRKSLEEQAVHLMEKAP